MAGRIWDTLTEQIIYLDADDTTLDYYGYRSIKETDDAEWFGAQDPADLERKRLDKEHGSTYWEFME
jgi:hypothetical protein